MENNLRSYPLGENLAKRGMLNNISCRHCGELETADHLFLHCNFTCQIWEANIWKQDFNLLDCLSFTAALVASSKLTTLTPLGVTETLFQWVCWGIWRLGTIAFSKTGCSAQLRYSLKPSPVLENGSQLNPDPNHRFRHKRHQHPGLLMQPQGLSASPMRLGAKLRTEQVVVGVLWIMRMLPSCRTLERSSSSHRHLWPKQWPSDRLSSMLW